MGGDIFHPKSHWIPDYQYPEIQLKVIQPFSHPTFYEKALPQGPPLTYLNDGGGGGSNDFIESEILAKSDFLGSMKDVGIFLGRKKNKGIFWGCEKRTKGFFGVC